MSDSTGVLGAGDAIRERLRASLGGAHNNAEFVLSSAARVLGRINEALEYGGVPDIERDLQALRAYVDSVHACLGEARGFAVAGNFVAMDAEDLRGVS